MARRPGTIVDGREIGYFPWSPPDFGEASIMRSFPAGLTLDKNGQKNQYIKAYLTTAKHVFNESKKAIDAMDDQIDPQTVRSDLLRFLGSTIGVDLDDYEPADFQRSLVANAVQFYRIKGTKDSYRIRGKISGYDVQVTNIYRMDHEQIIDTVTEYPIGEGVGGVSQIFAAVLKTTPVLPGLFTLYVGSTAIAQDDGAGAMAALPGAAFSVSGTFAAASGALSVTLTPAPAVGDLVTADFHPGYENFALPTVGNGTPNQNISGSLPQSPALPNTVFFLVDGVVFARDDGEGLIVAVGGTYTVSSGSIVYTTGQYNLTVVEALTSGAIIGVTFPKTIQSEMMLYYPDDIYEIPFGSGYWYSTLEPGVIPGAMKEEGCGYCKTSFIRVLFNLVKPMGTSIPSSSENFFDRLVRKLRDITPIHVRDILYELRFTIVIDESANLNAEISAQEEITWTPTPVFDRFDVISLDAIPLDRRGHVVGTVTLE